jgi:hypothetical protein
MQALQRCETKRGTVARSINFRDVREMRLVPKCVSPLLVKKSRRKREFRVGIWFEFKFK